MVALPNLDPAPPLGYRFGVFIFAMGAIPNPIDIRFQKVSGLSSSVELETFKQGGNNLYEHRFPKQVQYQNLVLERGLVSTSLLGAEFTLAMSSFEFYTSNVMVSLFDENGYPQSNWLFFKAYPVKWSVSDLNAEDNSVVIDSMELAYTRFQNIRL